MDIAIAIVVLAVWFAVIASNVLKRKWGFTAFALMGSPWSFVGVSRLARPGSWWYRKRYDDAKRGRADERYPDGRYWPKS